MCNEAEFEAGFIAGYYYGEDENQNSLKPVEGLKTYRCLNCNYLFVYADPTLAWHGIQRREGLKILLALIIILLLLGIGFLIFIRTNYGS